METDEVKIYGMDLHSKIELDIGPTGYSMVSIMRVPGGWIYTSVSRETKSGVFVPFDNEFYPYDAIGQKIIG